MGIEIITQKTEEQKAKELADLINSLHHTQYQIIDSLRIFKSDIENLAMVYQRQQEEINRINRRQANRAKRGGYDLDDKEEEQQSSSTKPDSG